MSTSSLQHLPPPLPIRRETRLRALLTRRNAGIIALLFLLAVLYGRLPRATDARITDVTLIPLRSPYGEYYLTAKVTNTGTKPLVLPVFALGIDTHNDFVGGTAIDMILAPGETSLLCCGGKAPPDSLRRAREGRVRLLYSDPYTPEEFVQEQLELRPRLHLVVSSLSFEPAPESYYDGDIMLKVRFDNQTGQEISEVRATAITFDSHGTFVGACGFQYYPEQAYPDGVRITAIPGMSSAAKCLIQINMFRKRHQTVPESVPVAPSVH